MSASKGITIPLIRRMAVLRRAGLSYAAIAAVVNVDNEHASVSENSVRYHIQRHAPLLETTRQAPHGMGHPGGVMFGDTR